MKLELNQVIKGFKVERVRESKELAGTFYELRHEKTGASLCWMDNGDINKLFCVGFKTLPEDSTGVFHILEHSVLCGSKKYPVKEPFVDLMKSSMNTFLNAMTFQDKTIYPVSSRNERDFLNLTEVYLDAVFAPRCVIDPNAFRQEGWHLEIGEDGKPFINGVVYNEMKGATSGIDDILEEGMNSLLYTNCYGYNSGGDPVHIPELTYEQYKAMYHKYYHPSNARIFLDGAVPLEKTLDLICEYIDHAEAQDASHVIPLQDVRPAAKTVYYAIGEEEPAENRAMISFGKLIGTYADKRRAMMADVLCSMLTDNNDAPLKRAILDAGLGENAELSCDTYNEQARLVLTVRNTEADNAPAIRAKTEEVVKGLLSEGLDKSLLTAYLNRFAFRIKDLEEPAGLIRCIMSYQSSLYGGDPMLFLENDRDIEAMRAEIENGGFDRLLGELLLDFDSMACLTVLPSKTYGEQLLREEAERAQAIYDGMTEEEKAELTRLNDRLHAWQETPDSPEDTATLPVLPLSEVSPDPISVPTETSTRKGVPVMFHAVPSNGIVHLNMYFKLTDLKAGELPMAGVMAQLLTKVRTEDLSVFELQKIIKTYIGHLKFEIKAFSDRHETCTPCFAVSCDVLEENLKTAMKFIPEILTTSRFDEPDRIKELILQLDEATKQRAIMAGHMMGFSSVLSHYSSSAVVTDAAAGYSFRNCIKTLAKDFDAGVGALTACLDGIRDRSFVKSRMTIGITNTENVCVCDLIDGFPEGEPVPDAVHYDSPLPEKMGVRIPAQANFAEKGVAVARISGGMKVASTIIGLDFLWNRVRVQGGAYGVGLRVLDSGAVCHYTYRDPSPARSLDVFSEEAAFIREFCESGEKLDKYIISTIGNTEPLRSPAETGEAADADTLNGRTYDYYKDLRAEMLSADKESLLAFCDTLEACAKDGCVCVVGSEKGLSECEGLTVFDA